MTRRTSDSSRYFCTAVADDVCLKILEHLQFEILTAAALSFRLPNKLPAGALNVHLERLRRAGLVIRFPVASTYHWGANKRGLSDLANKLEDYANRISHENSTYIDKLSRDQGKLLKLRELLRRESHLKIFVAVSDSPGTVIDIWKRLAPAITRIQVINGLRRLEAGELLTSNRVYISGLIGGYHADEYAPTDRGRDALKALTIASSEALDVPQR